MTDKPEHEELSTAKIVDDLKTAALLGTNITYEVLADYIKHKVNNLSSRRVLEALAEVKSKKKVCDTFHSFGITKRIEAVPLSAIGEIEKRYK